MGNKKVLAAAGIIAGSLFGIAGAVSAGVRSPAERPPVVIVIELPDIPPTYPGVPIPYPNVGLVTTRIR